MILLKFHFLCLSGPLELRVTVTRENSQSQRVSSSGNPTLLTTFATWHISVRWGPSIWESVMYDSRLVNRELTVNRTEYLGQFLVQF